MPQYQSQSRPYARAALAVAAAEGAQQQWAEALDALAAVADHSHFTRLPGLPGVRAKQVAALAREAAADVAALPKGVGALVDMLAENGRLPLLPDIAAQYRLLWREQAGRVSVQIDCALELSEQQRERLRAALKKRLGAEPDISIETKAELGAGAVVRIGDEVIDASLRTRLQGFAQQLSRSQA